MDSAPALSASFNVVLFDTLLARRLHFIARRSCIFLAAGTLVSLILGGCGKPQALVDGPVEVVVTSVGQRDVPVTQTWVASLHGFVDAQIRAQVSGYLMQQDYRDGGIVKKGDLLFEIDPRPFRAALAVTQAQLKQAEAQLGKTEQDVKRYGPLAKNQAISQQEYDDAVQVNLAAQAQVAASRAAVDQAQLNLDFTRITSPVDGVAGIVQAQVGDLVGPGTGILTTVSTVDPMRVYFPISEQSYLDFRTDHPGAMEEFTPDIRLELILSNGSVYPFPGKFYAADREIDPNTGTLQIAALFPNPQNLLRPGQYGRVRAVVRTIKGALLVPQRALTELQGGYQIAVVDETNHAHFRVVKAGPQIGTDVVVDGNLRPGERVIIEGFQKVQEGSAVQPLPYGGNAPEVARP
jgi:membrane fusion protein (multidrug efflux system)